MEKAVLALTTTFPRWKDDTTPRFVYDLSARLAREYSIIVLAPHHKKALKRENMGSMDVRRFAYFKPESMQKLCYEGGMIPNMRKSLLAKLQMPFLILSEFFSAYGIIRKEKIGLIHAHWMIPQGVAGAFLKKLFKIPLITTIHGSDLFPLKNALFRKMQRYVVKHSDIITVNTEATRKELVGRFPDFDDKIKVIPMGIDSAIFRKMSIKRPKKYAGKRIILAVGRLSEQKGLQYLIDSMRDISRYDKKTRLLMIGDGAYKKELMGKVRENKLEDNVEFLGPMQTREIAKYHNYADIFVMPSLSGKEGTEALGLSMIEAMSSGCAVVATNVGGIPYALKDGFNGVMVREKDSHALSHAIIQLLNDRKKAARLGKNAASYARKNYSWEKVSQEFSKIYKKMLK